MAIYETQRNHLHNRLSDVLGEEDAEVLMSHLPPSGWSDVVRISDLDLRVGALEARMDGRLATLEARIDGRFAAIEHRFESIDHRFDAVAAEFRTVDAKLDAMDARFETRLGTQANRITRNIGMIAGVALVVHEAIAWLT
jgi:tetrahydromethanopterin S-methyltransferase subunit G